MPSRFSSLRKAYAWLDSQINFERNLSALHYNSQTFELEAFRRRLAGLGAPQREIKTIHIAGSRGKGSAAMALDSLLRASGLTTARFTSPHLVEYRERITINGEMISPELFMEILGRLAGLAEAQPAQLPPGGGSPAPFKTVFEHLTALFFLAAKAEAVDWAIVETGLGGRLDATNAVEAGPVLLTRIALEHCALLGNTLSAIAAEKAAILKPGGWGVAGSQKGGEAGEAGAVFARRARETGAELGWAEAICPLLNVRALPGGLELAFNFEGRPLELSLPILGVYQAVNLQNALAMLGELRRRRLVPRVEPSVLAEALQGLRLPGRMERLRNAPDVIIDAAHCPAGAAALAEAMRAHFGQAPAMLAVAMLADKDHDAFFEALNAWPGWTEVWCYPAESPRALSAEKLAKIARAHYKYNCVREFGSLESVLGEAERGAERTGRLVVTGSFYGLGRWRAWAAGKNG